MTDDLIERSIYGAAVLVFGLIIALFVQIARADGKTDFCYIEVATPGTDTPLYHRLFQHRPWRNDKVAGSFATASDAVDMAKKMECPLH